MSHVNASMSKFSKFEPYCARTELIAYPLTMHTTFYFLLVDTSGFPRVPLILSRKNVVSVEDLGDDRSRIFIWHDL